jgi:hypothetical protein
MKWDRCLKETGTVLNDKPWDVQEHPTKIRSTNMCSSLMKIYSQSMPAAAFAPVYNS